MITLSAVEAVLSLVSALTCLLIISIWIRQAKEGRQHYSLSFMFIWLLLVAILTFLSQFLLEPSSFNPPLLKLSGLKSSISSTYIIDTSDTPLSGLTAISNVKLTSIGSNTPKDANNMTLKSLSQLQTCVLFAHLEQVLWLGISTSLLRYTWYLYRSLRRKLGVVSPRLMEAVAEHDPTARGTRCYSGGGVESDMAAGFSFTRRSIRSFSDVWGMMPVFVVVPAAIVGLVIKTCLRSVFCCYCLSNHNNKAPISDQNRTVMEEEIQRKMKAKNVEDVFEAWPKWPKYMEDDPSVNHREIGPPNHQLTEIRVHSQDVVSPSSRPTTAASIVSEHPTLATKLRVAHLDLNDTHEESYGYDITKQRIRYHRNSWSHKTRVMMAVHQQLIGDIVICVVIPALAFVPLYIVPVQGRAYDVYPDRGGCRVSSSGGSGDLVRTIVLLILNTIISVLGLLFAILSILQFKKQNGALSFKMKSLTPSPAVLRLYKSTEIVKNILLLCGGLNTILALGCIIHLSLTVSSKNFSTNSNPPKPLFRLAERDQDVLLVVLAIILVVVTYLATFWTCLRKNWRLLFYCFRNAPSEEYDDDSANASTATFPNYPKPLEKVKVHQQRSITLNRYLTQTTSTTTTSTSRASVDPGDNEMTRLERPPGSRIGIVEPSMIISFGSERRVTDSNEDLEEEFVPRSGLLNSRHVSFTKADSCHISIEGPSKPEQAAQVSDGRSTTDSSSVWLSSAPINADGALTAIPSTSISCASFSPTLTSTSTTPTFVSSPLPVTTLSSKISKSTLRSFSSPELLAYTQGPLPTIPDQRSPAAKVKGRLQSHSIAPQSSSRPCSPVFLQTHAQGTGLGKVGTTSMATGDRDGQKVALAVVGKSRDLAQTVTTTTKIYCSSRGDSQPAYPLTGRRILQNQGSYPTSVSICTPHSSSDLAVPLRLPDKDTLPPIPASSGDDQPTTASTAAKTAVDFDFDYDCNLDDDDMETMGAISLEELVFDEHSTDYDSIHQTLVMTRTTLPSDNRAMLESIVHHAFMSSSPPPTTPFPHRASSSRQSTSRRSRGRRPSVIQHANLPYYGQCHGRGHGHISRASSGRSTGRKSEDTRYHNHNHHPLPLRGAYFHLVSRGINVVDLYGDADDDDETAGVGAEFMTASAMGPRGNHHRKKSSLGTIYNFPFQPQAPPSCMPQHVSVKGKCPVGGGCVRGSTVFENGPPRPDSPTDPRDP